MKDDGKNPKKTKGKSKKKAKSKAKSKAKAKPKAEAEPKEECKSLGGRPKTLLEDLPDDWQSVMLQLYDQGATDIEVRAIIKVHGRCMSNDLWYRLRTEEPMFSETVKEGKILSEAYMTGLGRRGILMGKDFNAKQWDRMVTKQFPKEWQPKKLEEEKTITHKIVLEVGDGQRKVHDVLSDRESEKGS